MSKTNSDVLREHTYDGIQEYDNPTPGWWTGIFAGSVVFSVLYWMFFHVGTVGWTLQSAYESAVVEDLRLQFEEIGELSADEPTILRFMHDEKWLKVGNAVYRGRCVSCHGADAEGLVGPNLTDDHWKNVKRLEDIARVVTYGANNNAMPSWKNQLHPNEIVLVSAYVASLRGEHRPGPRGPEGDLIAPWPIASAATSQPVEPDAGDR